MAMSHIPWLLLHWGGQWVLYGLAIHLGQEYEGSMQTDGDETTPPGMQRLVD